MVSPKAKGMNGEYEVIGILQTVCDKVCLQYGYGRITLERNLEQVRYGGSDINGLDWAAIEVKRRENDSDVEGWWRQTKFAATDERGNLVRFPILFSRKNRSPWKVRMYVGAMLNEREVVRMPGDISLPNFLIFFEEMVRRKKEEESQMIRHLNAKRVDAIRRDSTNGTREYHDAVHDLKESTIVEYGAERIPPRQLSDPNYIPDPNLIPYQTPRIQIPEAIPRDPRNEPKKPWE